MAWAELIKLGAFLTGKRMKRRLAADAAVYSRLIGRDEKRAQAGLQTARKTLAE
jgi:hypothetical protein